MLPIVCSLLMLSATPVTFTYTDTTTVDSIMGFGAEDDGWFFTPGNIEACNPGESEHDPDDLQLRTDRINWLDIDLARMFFHYEEWFPLKPVTFNFIESGDSKGWQHAGNGITGTSVTNGQYIVSFEYNYYADPMLNGPFNAQIDADTCQYLVMDLDIQSANNNPITFQFFWDRGAGFGEYSPHIFYVTPNQGMQRVSVDLSNVTGWEGNVIQIRIDPSAGATESQALDGKTCAFDFIGITDTADPPVMDLFHFEDPFFFDYELEQGWRKYGTGIDSAAAEDGSYVVTYEDPHPASFDPYIVGPGGMYIDTSVLDNLVLDVDVTSDTSTPVNFEFFFDTGSGFNGTERVTFTVTPNQGLQRVTVDLSSDPNWTGIVRRIRIDPGTAANEDDLEGHTCSFDLIALSDNPSNTQDPPPPAYQWDSELMQSHYASLDVLQDAGVDVIYASASWGMGMIYDHPEWIATCIADLMEHLTVTKGYDCIKYWTLTNEPSWSFWDYGSTFSNFVQIHSLVNQEFIDRELDLQIVGSDDAQDFYFFKDCVDNSTYEALVDVYSSHRYFETNELWKEKVFFNDRLGYLETNNIDKPFFMGEYGFDDGRAGTHGNPYMEDYGFAVDSAQMLIRGIDRGMAGASVWILHEMMYWNSTNSTMGMGLWGYKDENWATRPVYHAVGQFTRMTNTGDTAYDVTSSDDDVIATRVDNTLFFVNPTTTDADITVASAPDIKKLCIMYETNCSGDGETGDIYYYPGTNVFTAPAMSFGYAEFSRTPLAPDFDQAFADESINPAVQDGNGGSAMGPNGIVDSDELALLAEILDDDTLSIHDDVLAAWQYNFDLLYDETDVDKDRHSDLSAAWQLLLAGIITLGDSDSVDSVESVVGLLLPTATLSTNYDLSQEDVLSLDGDADNDGVSNYCEYYYMDGYTKTRSEYLTDALDPARDYSGCGDYSFDAALAAVGLTSSDLNGPYTTWFGLNYMLDANEFALIEAILDDPTLSVHDDVEDAFEANLSQMFSDIGSTTNPNWVVVLAGYLTLGDDDSVTAAEQLLALTSQSIDEQDYDLTQSSVLAKDGDADDDGAENYCEYVSTIGFSNGRTTYLAWALDDTLTPYSCGTPDLDSALTAIGQNPLSSDWNSNTIPDGWEFKLMSGVIDDETLAISQGVATAYAQNFLQMKADLQPALQYDPDWDNWSAYFAAHITCGDFSYPAATLAVYSIYLVQGDYDLSAASYLSDTGDADGDSTTNYGEYQNSSNRADYVVRALDPAQ